MGLIAGDTQGDPAEPPNFPPSWTSTPSPNFEEGIGGVNNLSNNTIDPEGDTLTYTLAGGSWPTGVTMSPFGVITATTSVVEGTTAGITVNISDGINPPVTSPSFSVVISAVGTTTLFPLLATMRIGTFNYSQSGALAADDRKAMGLMDAVLLGGFFGTPQDSTPPPSSFISRTDVTQEILDAHFNAFGTNDIYTFTYLIQMQTGTAGAFGTKCQAELGPNGVNGQTDWFYYDQGGNLVPAGGESPGGGFFINLSDEITLDSGGLNFCEWYTDNFVIPELLDVHDTAGIGVGEGGMNGWWDNLGIHMRKSGIDPDQNGSNNDMQDFFDPDNPAHVAADPGAVQFVGEYRKNQRSGLERAQAAYPGLVVGGNSNQYAQGYTGPVSGVSHVMKEYRITEADINSKAFQQVGFSENNNWRPTELKDGWMRSHTLWTGVSSAQGGSWQTSYNNIYMPTVTMTAPAIQFGEWIVDCLQNSTDGPDGRPIWPNEPRSGSAWNAERWGHATNALCGAHHVSTGVIDQPTSTAAERRATALFDEHGLINGTDYGFNNNGNVTKLYRKWMGAAVDPVQTTARQGTWLWMREFENCLVIINTNWDDTDPDETVDVSALPGGASKWKRFNGHQDSAWNDGTDASIDFDIPSIDAIFLVDKTWYNAL
jgi:hypothetical protein